MLLYCDIVLSFFIFNIIFPGSVQNEFPHSITVSDHEEKLPVLLLCSTGFILVYLHHAYCLDPYLLAFISAK